MFAKSIARWFLASLVLGAFAQAATAEIIGYWRFEDVANLPSGQALDTISLVDSSSYGNNGVGAGSAGTMPVFTDDVPGPTINPGGLVNSRSLQFAGAAGSNIRRVQVADSASLATIASGFTVEAFVKGTIDGTDRNGIASKWSTTAGASFQFRMNTLGQLHLILAHPGGTANSQLISENAIPEGQWVHVAATWSDGDEMKIYINGVLDASATYGGGSSINTGTDSLWLGAVDGGTDYQFPGYIDEVRISNTALRPSEFLIAVPEPSVIVLLLSLLAMACVARRK